MTVYFINRKTGITKLLTIFNQFDKEGIYAGIIIKNCILVLFNDWLEYRFFERVITFYSKAF